MRNTKHVVNLIVLIGITLGAIHTDAQTTGWSNTGGGVYTNTANWVGGDINGVFDASLTLDSSTYVTFTEDTVLNTPLAFEYAGSGDLFLRGDGSGPYTMTLGGDITCNRVNNDYVTIGNNSASYGLNVDLGGAARTFTVPSSKSLLFYQSLTNGSVILEGGGYLYLSRKEAMSPTVGFQVNQGSILRFQEVNDETGGVRVADLTLKSGQLYVSGNNTADSKEIIAGALTVKSHATGGCVYLNLNAGHKHCELKASTLDIDDNAVLLVRGDSLGATPTDAVDNVTFTTPPALIGGGGAAGTTTMSIVPSVVGGINYSGSYPYWDGFITYGANGLRSLDEGTEYVSTITSGADTDDNVMIPYGSAAVTVSSDTSINALTLKGGEGGGSGNLVDGTGTLTIKSGMVYFGYDRSHTPEISVPLNFGSRRGIIGYPKGKNSTLSSDIAGTGGLLLFQPVASDFSAGVSFTGTGSTYTGDTYVLGRATITVDALPSGARTGDFYVYGYAAMRGSGTFNGIYGSGGLEAAYSGSKTWTIGDNDADGDFDGSLTDGGALTIIKTGAGTQRFGGTCVIDGSTTVNAGTLLIDGNWNSAVSVSSGASLGGTGTVSNTVAFADGAKFYVGVTNDAVSGVLSVTGAVSNAGTVAVDVDGSTLGGGSHLLMTASSIAGTFTSAYGPITKQNGDTELWIEIKPRGTMILIK